MFIVTKCSNWLSIGFEPGARYKFIVVADNTDGSGSASIEIQTRSAPPAGELIVSCTNTHSRVGRYFIYYLIPGSLINYTIQTIIIDWANSR